MRWILFIILLFSAPIADAKVIDFKYNYQDYLGEWYTYTNENLAAHPYYTVTENENNYTISRMGTTVNLPKRTWIDYEFYPDRIKPVVTIQNYSQINELVTKVNSTAWYLSTPWSASQVKSVTDDLIDMGVFKRTLDFSVSDSNTSCGEACPSYSIVPKVVGGDIRLYFNPSTYSSVVWPLKISENTITVSNATTQGWSSSNISLNGSRYTGDGKLAINLAPQYLTNLSCYLSMDETQGDIIRGISGTSNGLPDTNCQGTWYGNASINSTDGMVGNAVLLDAVDDFISIVNSVGLNASMNTTTTAARIYPNTNVSQSSIIFKGTAAGQAKSSPYSLWVSSTSKPIFYIGNGTNYESAQGTTNIYNLTWVRLVGDSDGTNLSLYHDMVLVKTVIRSIELVNNNANLRIGDTISSNRFKGRLDEVGIWNGTIPDQNISFSTSAMPVFLNQTANTSNRISKFRISYTGHDSLNNASIFANKSKVAGRTLIVANAISGVWYDIPLPLQNQTMDFAVEFRGNGSNTILFNNFEWDETYIVVSPTFKTTDPALILFFYIIGIVFFILAVEYGKK